jgi:hypothetical protein
MIQSVEKIYKFETFKAYKMTLENEEVWNVPLDEANRHYQAIQQWISEGNTVIDNEE